MERVSPPIRLFALVACLAAVGGLLFMFTAGRGGSGEAASVSQDWVHRHEFLLASSIAANGRHPCQPEVPLAHYHRKRDFRGHDSGPPGVSPGQEKRAFVLGDLMGRVEVGRRSDDSAPAGEP